MARLRPASLPRALPATGLAVLVAGLGLACDAPPGEGGGEGEGEGEGEAFEVIETVSIDEASPLVVPGFSVTARPDGRYAVAWFESTAETVTCDLFSGGTVQGEVYRLMIADEQADGSQRVRVVDDAVPNTKEDAVDLAVTPDGDLLVAYMGGEVTRTFCGASDLMLATEDGDTFAIRTVADSADTGTPCRGSAGGDPYCAQGEVVGMYPGISVNADGDIAIAYLDTHFGFADTDIFSSDLELAFGTPQATQLTSINMESGGGYFAHATIADDGLVVMGHGVIGNNQFIDEDERTFVIEDGLYAEVRLPDGEIRSSQLIRRARTTSRVATGAFAGQGLFVAVHEAGDEQLLLFRSSDQGTTWEPSPVEQLGRTGRDPSLVFLDDGTLVLAYGHCRDDQNQESCSASSDGVRLAKLGSGGRFERFTITGDPEDLEGVGAKAAQSGARELVIAHLNTSLNTIIVHRVSVR
jgi:hypothetical protein